MPLMYFCAEELLAADRTATTFNERMHAPAQRIVGKLRTGLKPDTCEKLVLAYHYLREEAKKQLAAMTGNTIEEKEAAIDWEEMEEEVPAPDMVVVD